MVVDLSAMMDALLLESVLSSWERKTREHESAPRRASTSLFIVHSYHDYGNVDNLRNGPGRLQGLSGGKNSR